MKKIFLVILTITSLSVAGQNYLIGWKGGANFTNVSYNNTLSSSQNNRVSFVRGFTYEYLLNKHFSLGADLLYDQRGWKIDIPFYNEFNIYVITVTNKEDFTYLSLPLKAGYNFGGQLYGFINLGVIPARLLSCKVTIPHENRDELFDNYSNYRKYDIAGLAELGGGYKIKDKIRLFSSYTYQHSFITASLPANGDLLKTHYGMSLTVGLKYAL